jgi:hypothetical protein
MFLRAVFLDRFYHTLPHDGKSEAVWTTGSMLMVRVTVDNRLLSSWAKATSG